MFKHILVATDGSHLSGQALQAGAELAKALGARLSAVYVMPTYAGPAFSEYVAYSNLSNDTFVRDTEAEANRVLETTTAQARQFGVECTTSSTRRAHPYEGVIETANDKGCDLIVMASHGRRGVSAMVLGSETNKVLTHSKIPVLVCR
jgi:nucleotide-binding universal stress UspA family protein